MGDRIQSPPESPKSSVTIEGNQNNNNLQSNNHEGPSLVVVGCPQCQMYVMANQNDIKCPQCQSISLIHFMNDSSLIMKSPPGHAAYYVEIRKC